MPSIGLPVRALHIARAVMVLVAIAAWNAVVGRISDRAGGAVAVSDVSPDEADLVEHERNWYDYLRGFHVHNGGGESELLARGSFIGGLLAWRDTGYLRGYTRGDDVYVCPNAPRILRVHQAGHSPTFGRQFEPLMTERRPDGGLDDEPLRTLDVMLPGGFPHTLVRLRDLRGLGATYDEWLHDGRIARC